MPGFSGDGFTCSGKESVNLLGCALLMFVSISLDIDECSIMSTCGSFAECNNSRGSFTCVCLPGFEGTNNCSGKQLADYCILSSHVFIHQRCQ